ncbi:MAG: DAK2 domain-containing protein, partial [Chloroflexi bacterium]|nr:DAK2 domain-containing protein [Chloroflexota bacterium]
AEALDGNAAISRGDLIRAMCHASDTAYAAVSNPVEGTMLTVLREAATLAQDHLDAGADEEAILQALVDEAYASVERTPDLLPRLREAGVIDAGGAGVAVILDGIARQLSGSPLPDVPRYAATEEVQTEAMEHEGHGYCTEFIIHGDGLDLQQIERGLAEAGGDSLLVVGDAQTVHVHVHMEDPGPALSIGARTGALSGVKVEDMQAQHEEWMAARDAESSAAPPPQSVGLVAIVAGAGLGAAFRDLGAGVVIELDGTTKASAGEILAAARRAGRDHAIILPNDRDILMAAETAAREAEGFLTAIPSANVAAGLAAAIYFRPGGAVDDLVDQMTSALADVICIEVSTAVRDATVDGIAVRSGDAIALVDGRMQHTAPTHDDALIEALASGVAEGASLITVYLGADAAAETGARIEQLIAELFPAIEVEVLPGGQPHYVYIASVE